MKVMAGEPRLPPVLRRGCPPPVGCYPCCILTVTPNVLALSRLGIFDTAYGRSGKTAASEDLSPRPLFLPLDRGGRAGWNDQEWVTLPNVASGWLTSNSLPEQGLMCLCQLCQHPHTLQKCFIALQGHTPPVQRITRGATNCKEITHYSARTCADSERIVFRPSTEGNAIRKRNPSEELPLPQDDFPPPDTASCRVLPGYPAMGFGTHLPLMPEQSSCCSTPAGSPGR